MAVAAVAREGHPAPRHRRRAAESSDGSGYADDARGREPFCENRDEVEWCATCFDYYAEIGRNARGSSLPPSFEHQVNFTIKEPYGVVVAIVPWNYPLLLMAWKLAPALAAGNTIVLKPSEETPLATLALADVFAALPPGVVNIVTGLGEEIGEALVTHPGTDLVALTGSVDTGRRVGQLCAAQVKKSHLELGGNDPFIVCSDADLDVASRAAVWAAYLNSGQVCTGAKRFYVFEEIADDFTARVVSLSKGLRLGDGLDPEPTSVRSSASGSSMMCMRASRRRSVRVRGSSAVDAGRPSSRRAFSTSPP